MAHIHDDHIIIKISKLVKGNHEECDDSLPISNEVCESLESVVAELLNDDSLVIEVTRG